MAIRRECVLLWGGPAQGGVVISQRMRSVKEGQQHPRGISSAVSEGSGGKERRGRLGLNGAALEMLPKEFGLYHKSNGDSSKVFKQGNNLLRSYLSN